jgi:hypothetical protein
LIGWNKRGLAQLGTDQAKPGKEKVSLEKIKEGFFYFIYYLVLFFLKKNKNICK